VIREGSTSGCGDDNNELTDIDKADTIHTSRREHLVGPLHSHVYVRRSCSGKVGAAG